ncbi:MAG: VWA domain-containing protein [Granulosicoccaceae bacterium]
MKLPNPGKDKLIAVVAGVALSSTLAVSSAIADDTEVFFGQVTSDSGTHPNVMFVLDTSGSMNSYDGTSSSRLERMKDAMHTILDETANVNVGLMRFNGHQGGGAVLHPVRPIDGAICTGAACGTLAVAVKVSKADGDAEETGSNPISTIDAISGSTIVVPGTDPATMNLDGNSLFLGQTAIGPEGVVRKVGLHFEELNIPQGATITTAKVEFRANANDASTTAFNIAAEQVDSANIFTDANNDISNRTLGQVVPWAPSAWVTGQDYDSADISVVIQEIVDRANWCGGNNMNLVLGGTGKRRIRSYDSWATTAPTLRISYTTDNIPSGSGCMRFPTIAAVSSNSDNAEQRLSTNLVNTGSSDLEMYRDGNKNWKAQIIGVRFPNLEIPQGAVIETAFIEFTTDRDRGGDVSMIINAEDSGNAESFEPKKFNVSARSLASPPVAWNNLPLAAVGETVLTPNVAAALQQVIDRPDWARGNAAAFVFSGNGGGGYREYESFKGSPNSPPKLKVIYRHVVGGVTESQITVRDELKGIVNEMVAHDGTPLVDAYYEASLYMTGKDVDYGKNRGTNNYWSRPKYQRVSHSESWNGSAQVNRSDNCTDENLNSPACASEHITGTAKYISPMVSSCQTNHIVFLTDGKATSNVSKNKVKALIGLNAPLDCSTQGSNDERCGRELAAWLNETDHNESITGKQNISTYTIGFNYQGDFLKDIAREGEGQYFKAESASQLVNVFKDILGDVLAVDTSFVAPGATVNQFNRLTHRNDIYFALFKPDQRPTWDGNLKRYEVNIDGTGKIGILDTNGSSAVDETSGFFRSDSESWWSGFEDGNTVAFGGAAYQLDYDQTGPYPNRRAFTYLGDYSSLGSNGADLTAAASKLHESNNNITLAHLGIENMAATNSQKNALRSDLLKWTRGLDIKDENDDNDITDYRRHIGDPMHARPVILNYATANPSYALSTVFVGTNEGYLHAIERDGGNELFGFMPKELLPNIQPYFANQSSSSHPYGLDGSLSVWTEDLNNNVMIDNGEKAYLYAGMRRGGSNYYALDVSARMNPDLKWVIEGGPGGTPGFEELGQTWSRPVPNKIMFNGVERNVLIFGAGYDTNQDPDPAKVVMEQTPDDRGRGFFIVDAVTGEHLWSVLGSNSVLGDSQHIPALQYSVPSDIRALDTNNDGLTDQLYFGDMGGRVWRFDFVQYHQSSDGDLLDGGIIANLAGTNTKDHRRFYYEPDIAVIAHEGERFMSISIGSGWRAHPLNRVVDDRFFVLRSENVLNKPQQYGMLDPNSGSYRPVVAADLMDVTNDIDADTGPYGWYLDLADTGEKVLGDSVTVNNQVIFSSYKPSVTGSACSTAIGGGSVYVLNILNGSPRVDLDGDGDVDEDDRSTELAHGGIPPEPAVLITEHGPTVLVGPEQPVEPDFQNLTQRTYWHMPGDDEAEYLVEETTGN